MDYTKWDFDSPDSLTSSTLNLSPDMAPKNPRGRHSGKLSWTRTYCTSSEIVLPVAYNDPPDLSEDEKIRIAKAVQTKMETRRFASLVTEQKLQEYGMIPKLRSVSSHCEPL
ncbi:hypothetical protein Q3G72_001866 [Acer saccharum]|nr:hypothetical protein Q3G72_001866 [Acer saccharum]